MVDIQKVNVKSQKPRNYITADIDEGPAKKVIHLIDGARNDSDLDMSNRIHLHEMSESESERSQIGFNHPNGLSQLYDKNALGLFAQIGHFNLLLLDQMYDAYKDKADEMVGLMAMNAQQEKVKKRQEEE